MHHPLMRSGLAASRQLVVAALALILLIGALPAGVSADGGAPATLYALTTGNRLLRFASDRPQQITETLSVYGMQRGELLLGIDFRPANKQLYGLGSTSRLYAINLQTGFATAIGPGPFTPALQGTAFGFDFNPTVDRIRVVSDSGQDLRLHPDTGAVAATDKNLAYAPNDRNAGKTPRAVAAGYTNSVAGATTTQLYVIDTAQDTLVLQNPPNDGVLNTVGALDVDTMDMVGFDIAPSGVAFAALTVPAGAIRVGVDATVVAVTVANGITIRLGANDSVLVMVNLTTGKVTYISRIGGAHLPLGRLGDLVGAEQPVLGLAVQP